MQKHADHSAADFISLDIPTEAPLALDGRGSEERAGGLSWRGFRWELQINSNALALTGAALIAAILVFMRPEAAPQETTMAPIVLSQQTSDCQVQNWPNFSATCLRNDNQRNGIRRIDVR